MRRVPFRCSFTNVNFLDIWYTYIYLILIQLSISIILEKAGADKYTPWLSFAQKKCCLTDRPHVRLLPQPRNGQGEPRLPDSVRLSYAASGRKWIEDDPCVRGWPVFLYLPLGAKFDVDSQGWSKPPEMKLVPRFKLTHRGGVGPQGWSWPPWMKLVPRVEASPLAPLPKLFNMITPMSEWKGSRFTPRSQRSSRGWTHLEKTGLWG
jgi:hypothetical protein